MTQDERWNISYNEVVEFIEGTNMDGTDEADSRCNVIELK